ncbi:hypothetical protein WJX79_002608 [Trebouxia sp. C0005]
MDSSSLQEIVRPQDTKTHASIQLHRVSSLDALRPHKAEVLGYVSAQRSISPDLLHPLDLLSRRSSSFHHMGTSCSKSSSVGLSAKAHAELRSSSQSVDSPYLGVAKQPSQEAFMQLLQHHLFNKQDMKVMELDNIVAAMTGQSAQTEATCASLMVAHGFFFAAMKAVFVFPEVLRAVLEDIKLQVDVRQPDKVDSWFWAEADLKLLLQQFRGLKAGQQQEPRGAVTVGPGKSLTNSQVKKKNGLQKQREQLRAGERRKRQQAASLGVSPTVVARSQMSARSVAQQQVLTQRQRWEGPTAVAQQAAAEKLQMEQQALERDYEQLRQERLRYEKEEQWAAQQQAQPSLSQPQTQSRFAQEQASAELAHELARRKGAQADLERQYSQLQLQHQQSLERQRQAANAQQAQRDQEARLQQEAEAAAAAEAEQRRSEEQRMQQEQERLNAELSAKLAQQQAEEEERRQQQALAREAKELARQRAQLEAQLAAERGTAQGHGYSPTPLVTPKAAKGRRTSEDEAVSEVEEEPTSDNEEEVQSEAGASVSDVEEEVPPAARSKAAKANKDTKKEEEEVYSSVDSESDQAESEEYQEDFEEDEEQQAAASQKNRVQSSSQSAVARKASRKLSSSPPKQRRSPSPANPTIDTPATPPPLPPDTPDPSALKWAAKNPWFGTDIEMTYFAYEVHDDLIEQEGITADMPEYYAAISARVEAQFPERFFLPGASSIERQGSVTLAGGQVSNTGGSQMYRQGSSIGAGMYRQGSIAGPTRFGQGSIAGPAIYRQGSSIGSGSSSVAAALMPSSQQTQQQLGADLVKRPGPVVPALLLSRQPSGDRLEGPRSDRGVGSLYDRRTGTPRVPLSDVREEKSHGTDRPSMTKQPGEIPLTKQLSDRVAADMAWAVGQRADMA